MNTYKKNNIFNLNIFISLLLLIINCIIVGPLNSYLVIPLIIFIFTFYITFSKFLKLGFLVFMFKTLPECRFFIFFYTWLFLSASINFICGNLNFIRFLMASCWGYIVSIVLSYVIGVFYTLQTNNRLKVIKFIINTLYVIIFMGILDFITYKFMIPGMKSIFLIITGQTLENMLGYKMLFIPRIQSVFAEPSHYGWFLVCNIPIAMKMFDSQYKLYSNKLLNILYKKVLTPLLLLSILLTQSPINIVLALIVCICYKIITSRISIKNFLIISSSLIMMGVLILLTFKNTNITESFLNRIYLTVQVLGSLDKLIIAEPSLATRLISYMNMGVIGLQHPVCGVGWGQLIEHFVHQLQTTNIPLTPELKATIFSLKPVCNPSIFFKIFAETGLFGLIIFYNIYICAFKTANKLSKKREGIFNDFMSGVKLSLLVYIILTLYDSQLYCHYFWFIFGSIGGFYLKEGLCKRNQKKFG